MSKARILIVDDEVIIRVALRLALRQLDVDTLEADDGRAALALCAEAPPDLILLDLLMPDMTGIDVLTALAPDFKAKVPVIVVSATDDRRRQDEMFALGAVAFILKPFANTTLVGAVEHFLDPAASRVAVDLPGLLTAPPNL